jgi:hypothetical protein
MDLIEIDARKMPKPDDYRRVSWGEVTKALDKYYYVDLSVGRVFFKRLGQFARDAVNIRYAREHPEFAQMAQDAEILREFADNGIPLDPAHLQKLQDLRDALRPVEKMHYLECIYDQKNDGIFVHPMTTVAELDAFFTVLLPAEVDRVYQILQEMITSRPITDESKTLLLLAQEFGIPVAKDLTADNMTAEMTDALASALVARGEEMRAEMGRLKNGQ